MAYFMSSNTSCFFFLYCRTGPSAFEALDITNYCLDLLKILHQAASLSERVTAIKLVDAWCGKGQTSLRMRDVKTPDLSREDCERVVVYLLLEGVLREDFHFTPYSTISYLLPGPNAKLVQKVGKRVFMDFRVDSRSDKVGWIWRRLFRIRVLRNKPELASTCYINENKRTSLTTLLIAIILKIM